MTNFEIYENLKNFLGEANIKMSEPMSKHTSIKIGGCADFFVKVSNIDSLKKLLDFTEKNKVHLTVVGNGSNLLVKDGGIRGIVAKIDFNYIEINLKKHDKVNVTVGAGVLLPVLAQKLYKENISGFEFAAGIPGTVGGAVRMNAGAYGGELKDIVRETIGINKAGEIKTFSNDEQNFSYRHSRFCDEDWIIIETILELKKVDNSEIIKERMDEFMKARKEKQPTEFPSSGSTFKRVDGCITAKLIDDCGLKGFSVGGAQISEKHAGFIVNRGGATAEDVIQLAEHVKKCVYEKFGKKIELEVEVIGEEKSK